MSSPDHEWLLAEILPPAMELATAYVTSDSDPELFWDTMSRTIADAGRRDPATGAAQLLFGVVALAGILLDRLAAASAQDRGAILAQIHQLYLPPPS